MYIIFVQIKNYFIIIILTADDKRNETAIDTSDIRINLNKIIQSYQLVPL